MGCATDVPLDSLAFCLTCSAHISITCWPALVVMGSEQIIPVVLELQGFLYNIKEQKVVLGCQNITGYGCPFCCGVPMGLVYALGQSLFLIIFNLFFVLPKGLRMANHSFRCNRSYLKRLLVKLVHFPVKYVRLESM